MDKKPCDNISAIFSYCVESEAGKTKPADVAGEMGHWTQLHRCNDISEITLETETIDASALEDYQSRYIAGRQDTGGTWDVTFNLTDDVIKELNEMLKAAETGLGDGKRTWFQVTFPSLKESFFIVGQPGTKIPLPAIAQNELLTGAISIAIDEYYGLATTIAPGPAI